MALDFVGIDPDSPTAKCAAVHLDPDTGDGIFVGKIVDDPATVAEVAAHGPIAADEGVFRMPARMWPIIAEAASGKYERGRQGPGPASFADLVAATKRSLAHLEMREHYGHDDPAYLRWRDGERGEAVLPADTAAWVELVTGAVGRGVGFRRLRVVPEPLTDYLRWEHHITDAVNVTAGENVRWLPRQRVSGLLLPGNDLWLFDRRTVEFHHLVPDPDGPGLLDLGDEITNDPAVVAQSAAAFDAAWEHGIPHADYRPA